ncbi:MAG: sensor histidine kinase [Dysgonamonadaceae bacterium]|nr:sensor histidine kinase [Dysgonamonadaceae bacterium]
MKRTFLFILSLLLFTRLVAQNQDSINRLFIESMKHELEYVNSEEKELELNANIGICYNVIGRYDSARLYFNRALSLPGGKEHEGGRLITNLANSYGFEGQYAEALKHYMEALRVSEHIAAKKVKNKQWDIGDRMMGLHNILRTMANLAEIHYLTGNRKQALYYAERGKELYDKEFAKSYPAAAYMIPQILYVIGSVYLDRNELDKAAEAMLETYETADDYCRKTMQDTGSPKGMYMYIAYGKEGLARVSLARKNYDRALYQVADALKYAEMHGDPTVTAKILSTFSDIHLEQGNYAKSGLYAQTAMEMFPDYTKINPDAAFNAAAASLFSGDKEKAYCYFRLYADRMKANSDKQFRETMAGMEVIYETEKKELRITDLERQKILYIFIGFAGIILAVAIWIILKQKIKSEKREKELVVANAVFEGEKRERERFARDLHDGVNGMLSAIRIELAATERLQNIRDRIDNCIEEIRRLASGVMPVSLQRYGMKAALEDYCRSFPNVCFHFFGEDKRIDGKIELVVYYCTYELVHNSVKHSGATTINVQLIQENDRISLAVMDNGCGYDGESSGHGVGLKSLRDRITALNGKLEITSSTGNGTETTIEFKVENKNNNSI